MTSASPVGLLDRAAVPPQRRRPTTWLRPRPAPRWTTLEPAAVILLAWLNVVLPRLEQTLTTTKYRSTLLDAAPVSSVALRLDQLFTAMLVVVCAGIVLRRWDRLPCRGRRVLLALLAPWFYLLLRGVYAGELPVHAYLYTYPAVVTAIWVLQPPLKSLSLLGHLAGVTVVLSVVLAVVLPAKGLYRASSGDLIAPDKEILPWGLLIGFFTDSNNLGQVLVLGLPTMLLIPRRWLRAGLAALTCVAIAWTASRSSLAALGLCLGLVLALSRAATGTRRAVGAVMLLLLGAVLVLLPLLTGDPLAFTNRGAVWIGALRNWHSDPVFGLGSSWFTNVAPYVNGLGDYAFHAHNQFLQMLTVGGLLNVALVGVMFVVLARRALRLLAWGALFPVVFLATFFVSGTLEVSFGYVDRDFLLAVTCVPLAYIAFATPPEPAVARTRRPAAYLR